MQGGKELPTLHSRESLRHAPGMPTPSTPRPHLKDLGARLSKPVSTGNSCSPFPAARLLSKLHCASAGGKPSFSPQQTRRGFLPSLVNVPEESQSWSLPVVTISCIWVRAHTYLCTITGTLQKPAMDLQPAEVVSEECGHLHSVPGARPRLSEHLATAGLGAEKSWGCWGRSPLQAPFCCVTGSEGGAPAQLEADVSQNCWPFQDFTPGPGQHLAHSPGGEAPACPLRPEAHVREHLGNVAGGDRGPPFATSLPKSVFKLPCDVPVGGILRKPCPHPRWSFLVTHGQ